MSAPMSPVAAAAETFAVAAAAGDAVYVVVGVDGPAMVASPTTPERQVMLLWSDRAEAARWADVLVTEPRIEAITFADLLALLLPELGAAGVIIGPDWSDDPADPEFEPAALVAMLAAAALDRFCAEAVRQGHVYLLRGPDGLAGAVAEDMTAAGVLPLWSDRTAAMAFASGVWAGHTPTRVALADLTQRTLLWCVEAGWRVAPAFGLGLGELRAGELKARLRAAGAAAPRAGRIINAA